MFRKSAGYQQKQVAKLLGFNSNVSVWAWERAIKLPNGKNLIKLCILYNAQIHELYPDYYNLIRSELYKDYDSLQ